MRWSALSKSASGSRRTSSGTISTLMALEQPHDGASAVAALRREGAYGPLQIRSKCLKVVAAHGA
jgi:hypothetical protein